MKIFHSVKLSYFAWWCQIVLFCMMVSNCPRCQIVRGVKLSSLPSWCQIVLLAIMVSNCPKCQMVLGVKLSAVSNGPRIMNVTASKREGKTWPPHPQPPWPDQWPRATVGEGKARGPTGALLLINIHASIRNSVICIANAEFINAHNAKLPVPKKAP